MKKFFNSPLLSELFYVSAAVLGALVAYQLITLVLIQASCSYYIGLIHTILSILLLVVGLITILLSISQIIHWIIQKNVRMIWVSSVVFLFIVASVWGTLFLNVVHCFLYEANLGPTEFSTSGFYP
jgi:hypothetical protein